MLLALVLVCIAVLVLAAPVARSPQGWIPLLLATAALIVCTLLRSSLPQVLR